jgi:hypothetical protein
MNLIATLSQRVCRGRRTRRGRASGLALVLALAPGLTGCTREFFREWADQDVTEAVFEKSRDPRWRMEMFSIEPPSLSRFADPYDPDRPPAPPDDRASEALNPVPQWPIHRLITPVEGTGYNDMLEAGPRYEPEEAKQPEPGIPANLPRPGAPRIPAPPSTPSASPFTPGPNSGPAGGGTTPNTMPGNAAPTPAPPSSSAVPGVSPPQASRTPRQDPGVRLAAPITPDTRMRPTVAAPSGVRNPSTLADRGSISLRAPADPRTRSAKTDPGLRRTAAQETPPPPTPAGTPSAPAGPDQPVPRADSPGIQTKPVDLDTQPNVDTREQIKLPDRSAGMSGDRYQQAGAATAGLAGLLAPGNATFDETEAAALPKGSRPYIIDPALTLKLALINNRPYQYNIELIYQQALSVTLQRFAFQPQFYFGMSPQTGPAGSGIPQPSYVNSFLYRTKRAPGGQSSTLSLGTVAGFGKAFSSGAKLAAGFASSVVFNFAGKDGRQPTIQSALPLNFTQPFLSGGGRALTLEPLTLAERTLLYQVRSFARIRQEFVPYILTQANPLDTTGNTVFEPNIGYLNVIQQLQQVDNDRKTLAAFEQLYKGFVEMASGGGSGVSQLNVDQMDNSVQTARQSLLTDTTQYRILLDQFKSQLGLPPDVPLILDRGLLDGFRTIFDEIEVWFTRENRQPEELPLFVERLPALEEIFLDGRPVIAIGDDPDRQEDVLLAAERIALENRFDLMNARAQLYDAWRALAVQANGLKGIFNITLTNQYLTPSTTSNPFGFLDQAKQFTMVWNFELPLVRVSQRNSYRLAQITYRRQQRVLQSLEDSIKFAVRNDVRNLVLNAKSYDIQKRRLIVNLRQKDNAVRQIFAPPGPGDTGASTQVTAQTQALTQAQSTILTAQNALINFWVLYQQFRLGLYKDLGTIPYDEWEAYYELFPQAAPRPRSRPRDAATPPGPAAAGAPAAAPVAGR